MECRELWNTTSDESFHSDVLYEIDYMYSAKELENKDAECIFFNGNFCEDERGENVAIIFFCSLNHLFHITRLFYINLHL